MSSGVLRLTAVLCFAAWLMPATTTATPITDLEPFLAGDGFVLHFGHQLTPEDLLVLATRDDRGWHLGWFKRKLRQDGEPFEVVDLEVSTWVPTLPASLVPNTLTPLTDLNGEPVPGFDAGGTSPAAIATPEPTSLILLGSGLILVARRIQRRRTA